MPEFVGGEGAGRRGACKTKRSYPTEWAAYRGLDALVARGAYRPSLKVRPCWYGKASETHWHVMKRITKGRKGKRS